MWLPVFTVLWAVRRDLVEPISDTERNPGPGLWRFSAGRWGWGWLLIGWWIGGLRALFLHLRIQGWWSTHPSAGITRSRRPSIGCHCVVTSALPLILGGRLKSLHCMTWLYRSSKINYLRPITMTDCLKLLTVTSFHGASFNSQVAMLCRRWTASLGLFGRPSCRESIIPGVSLYV